MLKKILVAFDGSEESVKAFNFALSLVDEFA
ncbi:universal stress protein, partial [Thermodesulfovibrio yellowstonii]